MWKSKIRSNVEAEHKAMLDIVYKMLLTRAHSLLHEIKFGLELIEMYRANQATINIHIDPISH